MRVAEKRKPPTLRRLNGPVRFSVMIADRITYHFQMGARK